MTPSLLFVITSDPRASHRPAEALRMAAGIGVWRHLDLKVYLHGPAVLLLSEGLPDIVDSESLAKTLPTLGQSGILFFVQQGNPLLAQVPSQYTLQEITEARLAELSAQTTTLLTF